MPDHPLGAAQPQIYDALTRARANGHEWQDIHDYVATGTQTALANGHSQFSISQYLGWPAALHLGEAVVGAVGEAFTQSARDYLANYNDALAGRGSALGRMITIFPYAGPSGGATAAGLLAGADRAANLVGDVGGAAETLSVPLRSAPIDLDKGA